MTREEIVNSMSLQDAIQVFKDTNAYGTMDIAKSVILKALGEMPQWIPVSERLPEDGLYLVTTSKGQVQVHVFNHNGNSEEYWMRCNKAWMPLPEPYKASPTGAERSDE